MTFKEMIDFLDANPKAVDPIYHINNEGAELGKRLIANNTFRTFINENNVSLAAVNGLSILLGKSVESITNATFTSGLIAGLFLATKLKDIAEIERIASLGESVER